MDLVLNMHIDKNLLTQMLNLNWRPLTHANPNSHVNYPTLCALLLCNICSALHNPYKQEEKI